MHRSTEYILRKILTALLTVMLCDASYCAIILHNPSATDRSIPVGTPDTGKTALDTRASTHSSLHCVPPRPSSRREAKEVFNQIEEAFTNGNVNMLRAFLGKKIFVNLFTGENGLFSNDQTYFIMKKFFFDQPIKVFSFTRKASGADSPYGVGILKFRKPGMRSTAQVFISLTEMDDEWVINQITIALR